MNLGASGTHDVLGADSKNQQGIGDERTTTAPQHRFSEHQFDSLLIRQLDQFVEAVPALPIHGRAVNVRLVPLRPI